MGRLLPHKCEHGKILDAGDFDATVEVCEICDLLPWVDAKQAMPPKHTMVMGYFPEYEKQYQQEVCYWDGDKWFHYQWEETEFTPSHWSELYPSPKGAD